MSTFKGWIGEKITTLGLWMFVDGKIYRRFHDVTVPTSNGTTQIDHLLISPFGLFVIETKNYQGLIYGSGEQANWTQVLGRRRHSFQNPLRQNFRHTQCLADFLKLDPAVLHSIVLFVGDATLKTPMPPNVLTKGLRRYILSFQKTLLSETGINRILEAVATLKADQSLTKRAHLMSLQERHSSRTTCPACGSGLVERISRKGRNPGSSFFGCSSFPRCRYAKPA